MKTIGLIGGLTCESTGVYYELLNKEVRARLGDDFSSQLLLWSFDYSVALPLYLENKPGYIEAITDAGLMLKSAGAAGLMILSNSAHMGAENLAKESRLPVIHILDAIAAEINAKALKRPLVLGTTFVMGGDFYIPNLRDRVAVDLIAPNQDDQNKLNDILFSEAAYGAVKPDSKRFYLDVLDKAANAGADSVILGCTEHCMFLSQDDHPLPMLDSTALHVKAAVDFQLG